MSAGTLPRPSRCRRRPRHAAYITTWRRQESEAEAIRGDAGMARHRLDGLAEPDLSRLASAWHTAADLGPRVEVVTNMSRSRRVGFLDFPGRRGSTRGATPRPPPAPW